MFQYSTVVWSSHSWEILKSQTVTKVPGIYSRVKALLTVLPNHGYAWLWKLRRKRCEESKGIRFHCYRYLWDRLRQSFYLWISGVKERLGLEVIVVWRGKLVWLTMQRLFLIEYWWPKLSMLATCLTISFLPMFDCLCWSSGNCYCVNAAKWF